MVGTGTDIRSEARPKGCITGKPARARTLPQCVAPVGGYPEPRMRPDSPQSAVLTAEDQDFWAHSSSQNKV